MGLGLPTDSCYCSHTGIRKKRVGKMRYHNGVLRDERDTTLRLKPVTRKRKLPWLEYVPLIILCVLIAALLAKGIYHG